MWALPAFLHNHRKRAESSRRRVFSLVVVDSHGGTSSLSISLKAILTIFMAVLLSGATLGYFIHSYSLTKKELSDLQYVKEVAQSQAQTIMDLQEQYKTLIARLRQAELTQSQTREMLTQEGLIPQSQTSTAAVASRQVIDLTYRGDTLVLTPRDLGRALDSLMTDANKIQESISSVEGQVKELTEESARLIAYYRAQPITWPVQGTITSGFGWRRHPVTGYRDFHSAIDIGADYWASIRATADGVVTYAGYKYGYGRTIIIRHGYGLETLYAHCASIKVKVGSRIKRGDVIGYVGESGVATGPHVHYEIHKDGVAVNPMTYIGKGKEIIRK